VSDSSWLSSPRPEIDPWPAEGCTLSEARARIAVRQKLREAKRTYVELQHPGEPPSYWRGDRFAVVQEDTEFRAKLKRRLKGEIEQINCDLRHALSQGWLAAYGRPSNVMASPMLIPKDIWPALTALDLQASAAGESRRGGAAFFAVRVFPTLLAPDRVDLIGKMALAEVLKRFVFSDPEVTAWADEGIKSAPEFERVFREGRCFVHGVPEWPVNPERWVTIGYVHPDPDKRSVYDRWDERSPIEIVDAAEALLHRYRALTRMLCAGEILAFGLTEGSGSVERIPTSVWSHEDFHINVLGDVLQDNQNCTNPRIDGLIRRWAAVELRAGEVKAAQAFHVNSTSHDGIRPSATKEREAINLDQPRSRRTPRADAVGLAMKRARLMKRPAGLTNKEIAAKIAPFMIDTRMSPEALAKAVGRYFKKC
jgi:hypothetical protein